MTQTQAAKRLGISQGRLSQLAKDDGSVFAPRDGWTAAAVERARAELRGRRSFAGNPAGKNQLGLSSGAAVQAAETEGRGVRKAGRAARGAALASPPGMMGELEEEFEQLKRSPVQRMKFNIMVEKYATMKLDREMKLGDWLKKSEVEEGRIARVHAVKAKCMEFPARADLIGAELGLSESQVRGLEAAIEAMMRELCEHFANGGRGERAG